MRFRTGVSLVCLVAALAFVAPGTARPGTAYPNGTPVASPVGCPVTQPNGRQPPPEAHVAGRGAGGHGTGALWTSLWAWGEGAVVVPASHAQPNGSFGPMKWPWYRAVPGQLVITGQRLDAPAQPLQAYTTGGVALHDPPRNSVEFTLDYSESAFHPTGLVFPTGGCWESTGRVGDASLTFVVLVIAPPAAATPEATR